MKFAIYILFMTSTVVSQLYTSADPYFLFENELKQFNQITPFHQTTIRPFYKNSERLFNVSLKNEIYFNNNAPNQENMDIRYFAKGMGSFTSIRLTGYSKFLIFNFEPYKLTSSNTSYKNYDRPRPFKFLNDSKTPSNLKDLGLRKADIYLHYKGIGFGLTKDNMWWGPGIHGSFSMTNNTSGFNNFMIGTLRELRFKKIGIMGRYTFSELNHETNNEETYFTSLTGQVTFYSKQIITIGLSRNYLTGGVDVGVPWTKKDAQNIVFEGLFIKNLQQLDYTIAGHDPWDQTVSTWIDITFPKNKMKLYLEIGFNDNRFNLWDFIVHPDHAMGSIIGFRKYGLFNNDNLIAGFEYLNLIKGRHHIFRITPNWYDRKHYDDFSYDGRRWGAHSGSDSDDLFIFFGLLNEKWTLIPSINFERHGVSTFRPPEIKSEFRIDARYKFKSYEIGFLYENQFEAHLGFPPDQYFVDEITGKRRTNTLIVKFSSDLY